MLLWSQLQGILGGQGTVERVTVGVAEEQWYRCESGSQIKVLAEGIEGSMVKKRK